MIDDGLINWLEHRMDSLLAKVREGTASEKEREELELIRAKLPEVCALAGGESPGTSES